MDLSDQTQETEETTKEKEDGILTETAGFRRILTGFFVTVNFAHWHSACNHRTKQENVCNKHQNLLVSLLSFLELKEPEKA